MKINVKIKEEEIDEITNICVFLGELAEDLEDGFISILSGRYKGDEQKVIDYLNDAHVFYNHLIYKYYEKHGGITEEMK